MSSPKPRGPSADPKWPSSLAPDNPYNFSPSLLRAAKLPVKTTDKYVFFFGYEGDEPEVCLQQWFPAPFAGLRHRIDKGRKWEEDADLVNFPTSEHFMMYHKSLLMNDSGTASKILSAGHPSEAKRLGREVENFSQDLWNTHADDIVEMGNWCKFSDERNGVLKKILLGTGSKDIVEASPDDKIWGIGFDAEEAQGREGEWGNNGLGKALMRVRHRLRKET